MNVHGISEDSLKLRRVDHVDIVTDAYPPHKYKPEEDLTLHKPKIGRGPLRAGWLQSWTGPVVTSYKLAVIKFHSWPRFPFLEQRVQNWAWGYLRELQLVGHRKAVAWQDDWMSMTDRQLEAYESETRGSLDTRWATTAAAPSPTSGSTAPAAAAVQAASDALGPPPPALLLV